MFLFVITPQTHSKIYAHELYNGCTFRWNYVIGGICNLKPSNEILDTNLSNIYNNALSHWNSNSTGTTNWIDTSFEISNVDFATPTSDNWLWGDSVLGMTFIQNQSDQWFVEPDGNLGSFTSGNITYAQIQINPDMLNYSNYTKNSTLRHEMGHVVGLGHTDGNTMSLMNPYMVTDILEDHDRTDLQNFY